MGRFRMDRSGVRLWRRLIIERAQPSESFSRPALNTSVRWLIPTRPRHALGKIGLPSGLFGVGARKVCWPDGYTESAKSGHQGWLESGPKDYALSPIIAGQTVTTILPIC
jgi:hypothetical protein